MVGANADILNATYQTSDGIPFGRISMTNPSFEAHGQALLAANQVTTDATTGVRPRFTPQTTLNTGWPSVDESAPAEWSMLMPVRAGGRSSFNHHLNE